MKNPIIIAAFSVFIALSAPRAAFAIETAFEKDAAIPVVHLNIAVKAGSVTDPAGKAGLSNFVGEMLLRGTRTKTKEQIDLALDQMGAELSVEARAEALILRGAVLSSQLDKFLELVTEIVTQPSFPENEIRKLKSEIVSGILEELGNDQTLASRRFTEFLFQGHPYGKPVLGKTKDVEALTRQQIADHYEKLFRDPNLLVVGTGDADEGRIKKWAQEIGDARKSGSGEIARVPAPQMPASRRLLIVDKPERTQTQIRVGQIGVRMTDKDFFPLFLANHAFGGGSFFAKLMLEIRVKRGWSYGAYSYFKHGLRPRSWEAYLFPASKDAAPALEQTLKMIGELRDKGVTAEEFAFAQRSLVNSSGFMFNTPKKRVENTLLERTLDLPDGFMRTYGDKLQKVTLEESNSAAKKFLKPDQLSIAVVATAKDLKAALAKAAGVPENQVVVAPYTQE